MFIYSMRSLFNQVNYLGRVPELLKKASIRISLRFPQIQGNIRFSELINNSGTRPRFEIRRIKNGIKCFDTKLSIVRNAVTNF